MLKWRPRVLAAATPLFLISSVWAKEGEWGRMLKISALLRDRDLRMAAEGARTLAGSPYEEAALIALLDDDEMRASNPKTVGAAITVLGHMKSTNAVDRIADMLLYNEDTGEEFREEDWELFGRRKHMPFIYALFSCPSRDALKNIGRPAIPVLLDRIRPGRWDGDPKTRHYGYAFTFSVLWNAQPDHERSYDAIRNCKKTLRPSERAHMRSFIDLFNTEALRILRRIPEEHHTHYRAQFELAAVLIRTGQGKEAQAVLERLHEQYPSRKQAIKKRWDELLVKYHQ